MNNNNDIVKILLNRIEELVTENTELKLKLNQKSDREIDYIDMLDKWSKGRRKVGVKNEVRR